MNFTVFWNVTPCIRVVIHRRLKIPVGRDSAVGIATRYELDGPGIEFRWGPDRPWGLPSLLYNGYRVIPGGKAAGAWR
jgi:hypothetical protein